MTKLSIIVPVYYVEPYLPKCIDSILAQTMTDFELLLIVDGSPDRCAEICDSYAAKDNRIIVIHQQNHGVSAARNAGLKIAKGEYIGFVDPDDLIAKQFFSKMYCAAKGKNKEVACCDYLVFPDEKDIKDITGSREDSILEMDIETILFDLFSRPSKMKGIVWNKIYKRSVLNTLNFNTSLKNYEDLYFWLNCLSANKEITACFLSERLYYYRINNNSASRKFDPNLYKMTRDIFVKWIFPFIDKYFFTYKKNAVAYYLDFCSLQINEYKNAHKQNGYNANKDIRYIRGSLLAFVMKSLLKREIDRHTFNRYLIELLFRYN